MRMGGSDGRGGKIMGCGGKVVAGHMMCKMGINKEKHSNKISDMRGRGHAQQNTNRGKVVQTYRGAVRQIGQTDGWIRGVGRKGRWRHKNNIRVRCLWVDVGVCTDRVQWCIFSFSSLCH